MGEGTEKGAWEEAAFSYCFLDLHRFPFWD